MSVFLPKGLTGTPGVQGAEGKPGPLVGCVQFNPTFGERVLQATQCGPTLQFSSILEFRNQFVSILITPWW